MKETKHPGHLDTAIRLVETVRVLPVGRWMTTQQVHAALEARGYTVSQRTVQRDLWKLCAPFGIDQRADGRILEWKRTRPIEGLTLAQPIPATPEILEALMPKPRGIGLRIGVKR